MRVVLVHNPGAGDAGHSRAHLARLIRDAGHTVLPFSSKDDAWIEALGDADLVAAAGGDGTVGRVARTAAATGTPLAVLPMGTANNIAGALGLERTPLEELIAGWRHAAREPFDLGVARIAGEEIRFLESVGAGVLAATMAEIDDGHAVHVNDMEDQQLRLAAAIRRYEATLRDIPARFFSVDIDGHDASGSYVLIEVMNFGASGPNLQLVPHARPGDGLLDVVMVDDQLRREMAEHLPLYRDHPERARQLPVRRGREVRIRCEVPSIWHVDDKTRNGVGHDEPVQIALVPAALTLLVPPARPAR